MEDAEPTTTALAFKVPAEPGWRALVLTNAGDPDPSAPAQLELRGVHYWGFYRDTAAVPIGIARALYGLWGSAPAVEFRPLDVYGGELAPLLEVVSPADARANEVIVAEALARVAYDPLVRLSQK